MAVAKVKEVLLAAAETGAGTFTTQWFPSKDLKNMSAYLYMNTTAGSGTDTLDIVLEQAPTNDAAILAANPHFVRKIPLLNLTTGGRNLKFNQVTGGIALPSDTSVAVVLRQHYNIDSNNIDTFYRAKRIVAGTASNLGIVNLTIIADRQL
jgi:hypothetical protein